MKLRAAVVLLLFSLLGCALLPTDPLGPGVCMDCGSKLLPDTLLGR